MLEGRHLRRQIPDSYMGSQTKTGLNVPIWVRFFLNTRTTGVVEDVLFLPKHPGAANGEQQRHPPPSPNPSRERMATQPGPPPRCGIPVKRPCPT